MRYRTNIWLKRTSLTRKTLCIEVENPLSPLWARYRTQVLFGLAWRGWKLSQFAYVKHILSAYGLENLITYNTPIAATFYDELDKCRDQQIEGIAEYESMIGALIYLSTRSRPDISTAVGILSRFPTQFLTNQLKLVFGYLKGTDKFGIHIIEKSRLDLIFCCHFRLCGIQIWSTITYWLDRFTSQQSNNMSQPQEKLYSIVECRSGICGFKRVLSRVEIA